MIETYDPHKFIAIVGYPKSANTYLSRLIGDILASPVGGWKNAVPLATEGEDRKGGYYIAQLHLRPVYDESLFEALPDGWSFNIVRASGERIAHIIRDPRDIAVSVKFYWDLPTIRAALDAMINGTHPLVKVGKWNTFIQDWMSIRENGFKVSWISYESLLSNPRQALRELFYELDLPYPREYQVQTCVERQSFQNKIKEVENDGDSRPYGKTTQLKLLRKGIAGDWRNHLSEEDIEYARHHFGDTMRLIGYEP